MRAGPKGQIDTTPLDLSKLQHAGPKRVTAFIRASCWSRRASEPEGRSGSMHDSAKSSEACSRTPTPPPIPKRPSSQPCPHWERRPTRARWPWAD